MKNIPGILGLLVFLALVFFLGGNHITVIKKKILVTGTAIEQMLGECRPPH